MKIEACCYPFTKVQLQRSGNQIYLAAVDQNIYKNAIWSL